jgi:hypothetical protein
MDKEEIKRDDTNDLLEHKGDHGARSNLNTPPHRDHSSSHGILTFREDQGNHGDE